MIYDNSYVDATIPCEDIVEKIKKLVGEPRNYGWYDKYITQLLILTQSY